MSTIFTIEHRDEFGEQPVRVGFFLSLDCAMKFAHQNWETLRGKGEGLIPMPMFRRAEPSLGLFGNVAPINRWITYTDSFSRDCRWVEIKEFPVTKIN